MFPDDEDGPYDDELPEAQKPPKKKEAKQLFPRDEMSTGATSKLVKHAKQVIGGTPKAAPVQVKASPELEKVDVKALARQAELAAMAAKKPGRAQPPAKKTPPGEGDTFVAKKIRQAELNLPDWDDDEPG